MKVINESSMKDFIDYYNSDNFLNGLICLWWLSVFVLMFWEWYFTINVSHYNLHVNVCYCKSKLKVVTRNKFILYFLGASI